MLLLFASGLTVITQSLRAMFIQDHANPKAIAVKPISTLTELRERVQRALRIMSSNC